MQNSSPEKPITQPDPKLLRKAKRGDLKSIEALVTDFLDYVYTLAAERPLPRDEARSAAHDGLLYAIKHYNPEIGTFSGYVTSQVRFHILRAVRAHERHYKVEHDYSAGISHEDMLCESEVEADDLRERRKEYLAEEISKVSVRDQEMINQRLAGRPYKEIAKDMGYSLQFVQKTCDSFFAELRVPAHLKGVS